MPTLEKPVEPKPKENAFNLEYMLGVNGLLKGGAAVMIAGLIYLVGLAITRKWITTELQFAGEIAFCLTMVGVGIWKRNEREQFGQILMGLGSFGLYMVSVGATYSKGIFDGKALIACFLILGLINLGASWKLPSQAFWFLGTAGGFIGASVYAMNSATVQAFPWMLFLILVPFAWVVLRHKWRALAWVLVPASLLTLCSYCVLAQVDWLNRVVTVFLVGWVMVAVIAQIEAESEESSYLVWTTSGVYLLAAFLASYVDQWQSKVFVSNPSNASSIVLIFCAGQILIGRLKQILPRNQASLLYSALTFVVIWGPLSLARTPEIFTYFGVSMGFVIASTLLKNRPLSNIGLLAWGMGFTGFINPGSTDVFLVQYEPAFLVCGIIVTAACSWSQTRFIEKSESIWTFAAYFIGMLLTRLVNVTIFGPSKIPSEYAAMIVLLFGTFVFFRFAKLKSSGIYSGAGWCAATLACLIYLVRTQSTIGIDLIVVITVLVVFAYGTLNCRAKRIDSSLELPDFPLFIILCFWMRLGVITAGPAIGHLAAGVVFAGIFSIVASRMYFKAGDEDSRNIAIIAVLVNVFAQFFGDLLVQVPRGTTLLLSSEIIEIFVGLLTLTSLALVLRIIRENLPDFVWAYQTLILIFWIVFGVKTCGVGVGDIVAASIFAGIFALFGCVSYLTKRINHSLVEVAFLATFISFIGQLLIYGLRPSAGVWGSNFHVIFISMIITLLALAFSIKNFRKDHPEVLAPQWIGYIAFSIQWTLLTVLLKNELAPKLSNSTTIYAAWIPLAVAFLSLGFRFENRIQRLISFCLYGISVGWIFIVDLVQLDPAIRVLILLILGITMIAGGYAYVRSANRFVVEKNSKEE